METPTPGVGIDARWNRQRRRFLDHSHESADRPSPLDADALGDRRLTTACFAAMVMLTQSSVKGALAYSTIAQMGFMMLQCGLGAFSAAMLHIVAHSLYKAHAFLSSGGVIPADRGDNRRAIIRVGPPALPTASALLSPVPRSRGWTVGYAVTAGLSARDRLPGVYWRRVRWNQTGDETHRPCRSGGLLLELAADGWTLAD